MKRIAILTSGGDAPGMNAALRAAVRYAIVQKMEVFGVEHGYTGLLNGNIRPMDRRSVSDIIHRGGTILKTARCPEFMTLEGQKKAYDTLKKNDIDGLIVIGGDGSYRGLKDLWDHFKFPGVGLPGTIDNDLGYTDYTIGFDTAVNTVLSAINNIRDTMTSHDRACTIEVMGRKCGDIALYAGLAGGAEVILIPEVKFDIEDICQKLRENMAKGKASDIIILAEGVCNCDELKNQIQSRTEVTMRTVKLGHIQRGGAPSLQDRVLAARTAARAVELLKEGKGNRAVGIKNNKIIDVSIEEAVSTPKKYDPELFAIAQNLI